MLIKNSGTQSTSEAYLASGTVVMYENDGAAILGAVTGFKKDKYSILNERGNELELAPKRLHGLPGKIPEGLSAKEAKAKHLRELHEKCRALSASIKLDELWSLIHTEMRDYKTSDLCLSYLGNDKLENHLTLRLALLTDRIYFKRKNEFFAPRPAATVEELKQAEAVLQRKRALQDSVVKFFKERMLNPKIKIPEELLPQIHLLEDVAAGAPDLDNNCIKEAKDLLSLFSEAADVQLPGTKEQAAYHLLERIHHFGRETNLVFIRYKPRIKFSEEELDQASAITEPALAADMLDLTRIETITIDDESTKDMDDALSLERLESGNYRLGIHISDVASALLADSPLDEEARKRASSIYCPDCTINMLPESVSEGILSLLQGRPRAAVSCLYELDRNFEVVNSEIRRTLIKVSKRLSYIEVDDLLEKGCAPLTEFYAIAAHFEAKRIESGATKVHKRDVEVVLLENGDFTLRELDENTPARSLINEMMVLANTTIARFGADSGIPLVYRTQEAPDEQDPAILKRIPQGPAHDYALRARLKRSIMSFSPALHWSLGVKAYVHCTSPIRRYIDLCNQRQLVHFLKNGKPFYTQQYLEKHLPAVEDQLFNIQALSKETKRMWLQRHLQKLFIMRRKIRGTVIRTDLKTPLVELDEVYMPVLVKFDRPVKLGEEVTLGITAVDPRYDYVRLEEMR